MTLRYNIASEPALKGICLKIKKGQKIAIVGRSGSGKSSFIQVLYRLFEPDDNSMYFLYGKNALAMPINELRGHFSCISQSPFVIGHSIKKNIDPFDRYTDEEIKQVLGDVKMLGKILRVLFLLFRVRKAFILLWKIKVLS